MKIGLFDSSWNYTVETPYNEPLGGTQSAICYFAEELSKNHEIYIFNNINEITNKKSIIHVPYQLYLSFIHSYKIELDIVIVSCLPNDLYNIRNNLFNLNYKNIIYCLWTGHDIDQNPSLLLNENKLKDSVDLFIFVSDWQRLRYVDKYKIQYNKTLIMRNGIGKPFEKYLYINTKKIKKSLTYCSIPWRGLDLLKPIFEKINNIHSDTVLKIYSGLNIYKQEDNKKENIFNNMKSVVYNYGVSQNKLSQELSEIEILTYPNTFQETSCISILQAMACGCLIITSNLGALKETMNNMNEYIDINIYNFDISNYINNFVIKLDSLIKLSDKEKQEIINKNKLHIKENYTWEVICNKFITDIKVHINDKINFNTVYIPKINDGLEYFKVENWIETLKIFENVKYFISESHYNIIKLNIGVCYYKLKQYEKSKENFKIAKTIIKDFNIYRNLAMLELEYNHLNKYFKYARRALSFYFDPLFANLLAEKLETVNIIHESLGLYESILKIEPDNVNALNNLGNLYLFFIAKNKDINRSNNKTYNKSFELCTTKNEIRKRELVYSNIIFNSLYNWNLTDEEIYNISITWPDFFPKTNEMINISKKLNRLKKNKKIRVGYLSSDFITHPVGYMFDSILKNHNTNLFEIFCYDNAAIDGNSDVVGKRLRGYNNAKWYRITNISDKEALEIIINDELDILIDMMGHTRFTRLNIVQYKPAKIIISYFAYPSTNGMKEIDYRFTDKYANPPETQKYFIEKFYYLPNGFQCYTPPVELPTNKTYEREKYKINLCCFNNPVKLSLPTIEMFIEILKRLPNSKLYLRYLYYSSSYYKEYMLKFFTDEGISADRLDIGCDQLPNCLYLYDKMDIVLDPFPYNGGTISSEALYMNTPLITLAGTNYVSRVGVSLLSNLGLEKYIAYSKEEYIQKVIDLANNEKELKELHKTIRNKMLKSGLANTTLFTKHIEEAYKDIMTKYWTENGESKVNINININNNNNNDENNDNEIVKNNI